MPSPTPAMERGDGWPVLESSGMAHAFWAQTARALLPVFIVCCESAFGGSNEAARHIASAAQLYEELEYERALDQLAKAKAFPRTPAQDVAIALYQGIILADMGRAEESRAAFRAGLRVQADAALPVKVSPKVEAEFENIRREYAEQAAARKQEMPAAPDRPQRQKPVASLKPSAPPPEIQLSQPSSGLTVRRAAPYVLVGAAVVAGALGTYFGVQSRNQVSAARGSPTAESALSQLDRANSNAKLANGFFAGAGAAAIGGALAFWLWRDDPGNR
jgi:tetratricopeptide (TPR) repeat protein